MKQIELQTLDRKKLQKEGLDFLFQYETYKRDNEVEKWVKRKEYITSYEPEEVEQTLSKQQLFRIILVPFRFTPKDEFNQIKLEEDWVPVKESDTVVLEEELKSRNIELWKM